MSRIIPGLMLAACWLLILLSGSYAFFLLVIVIMALVAGCEYLKMALGDEARHGDIAILVSLVALPVVMTGLWQNSGLCAGLFFSIFLSVCFILSQYTKLTDSYSFLSRLVFGIVYVGFLLAHLLLLWHLPEGNLWLIILAAVTAGSDSGAYYCGKKFGKNKLCRHVSPNKTIEGAVGGLLCSIVIAILFAWLLLDSVNWAVLIPMVILLTGVGIMGDLCESVIKRGTNTKDSGRILLGHGGILDRIDSMILTAPLLYYLLIFSG